jgi:predicted ATPase
VDLIAREDELAEVTSRVGQGRRLVTVIGPGGIGKTALAREAVDRLSPGYPMGTHLVELSRISRADAVSGTMAAQLGFSSFETLLGSPVDLPVLLLIDNCEHVVDAAAEAIDSLLDACDAVTVIATSRSPLAIDGESLVALAPLPIPGAGAVEANVGAVRLFCERARDAGVVIRADQLDEVAELCRRLDGMPLAIELAAARTRLLALTDLLGRLSEGIDVLARPRHRGTVRHRSVHETIEWSARLLDESDRAAFAHLGVCAGPCSPELAAAVVGGPAEDANAAIERLVDVSLVEVDRSAAATRYRMLEPIRAVAVDELARRDGVDAARERLAAHVLELTSTMMTASLTRWDADLLPTLIGHFDQIDVALRHSLAHDADPTRALILYAVLWGTVHQARIDEVLALGALVIERWPDASVPYGADARATFAMGQLLCGHTEDAVAVATSALEDTEASVWAPAALRRVLGLAARIRGDHATSQSLLADAALAAREHGIPTMDLECQVYRAQDLVALGRAGEALDIVRTVAEQARALPSTLNEIWARTVEASALSALDGSHDEARRTAAQALAASEQIAYPFGIICNLQTLAAGHLRDGELPDAAGSAARLLDAVSRSGAGDLRRALDVATAVLAAAGHHAARDLAATAQALPDTNPMVLDLECSDELASRGTRLERPAAVRLARRALAQVRAASPDAPPEAPHADASGGLDGDAVFMRSGDLWEVRFAGATVHIQTSKGMEDLAVLLARPGREVHCLELAGAAVAEPTTGEVIDAAARRRYEDRIRELQAEVEEAEDHHDLARAERAQAELDHLVEHLANALGLGGAPRRQGGTTERARSAVTHRLRGATRRLAEANPALGRHLEASLSTGTYCCYRPELPTNWRI